MTVSDDGASGRAPRPSALTVDFDHHDFDFIADPYPVYEHFEDAERAILDRQPNGHLAFGHGVHVCLGAPLARVEIAVALRAFLALDLDVGMEGPIRWSNRGDLRSLKSVPVRISRRRVGR